MDAIPGDIHKLRYHVAPVADTTVLHGGDDTGSHTHIWIENRIASLSQGKNQALNELNWKLARMACLFHMVGFHIRKYPNIAGILSQRIARKLTGLRAFEVFLAGILRWNPNRVQVECVIIALRQPKDSFVPARQLLGTMQTMLEVPNDAVAQLQAEFLENRIQKLCPEGIFHLYSHGCQSASKASRTEKAGERTRQ
jgi:hypothetical protein